MQEIVIYQYGNVKNKKTTKRKIFEIGQKVRIIKEPGIERKMERVGTIVTIVRKAWGNSYWIKTEDGKEISWRSAFMESLS